MTWRKGIRLLAVGVYLAVTRLALLVAFVFACLFFVLNSRPFPDALSDLLRSVLPGTLSFGTIQASPIPWRVDVLDVGIDRPDGERVVRASSVRVHVDLLPLIDLLIGRSPNLLHLHFPRVRLNDFDARIVFDDDMNFRFLDAFDTPGPPRERAPGEPPGLQVRLSFDDIDATDGTCFLRFPEWELQVRDIRTATRLFLKDGRVRVQSAFVDIGPGHAILRVAPDLGVIPRRVGVRSIRVDGFLLDHDRLSFDQVRLDAVGMELEAQDGALDWAHDLAFQGRAFLFLPDGSPVMRTVSSDRVHGALQVRVQGRGDARDPRFTLEAASPDLTAGGLPLGAAWLSLSGGRDLAGHWALAGVSAELGVGDGRLRVVEGSFHPFGDGGASRMAAMARVELSRFDLSGLLAVFGVALPGPPVPIPTLLDGTLQARLDLQDTATLSGFAEVVGALSGPLPPRTVLAGREASVRVDARLEGALVRPRILVRDLEVRSGPDVARVKGVVDLTADRLALSGAVDKELGSLLAAAGQPGGGALSLSGLSVAGSLLAPSIRAGLQGRGLSAAGWAVDAVSGTLSLAGGELSITDLRAEAPYGEVQADRAALALFTPGTWTLRPGMRLSLAGVRAPRVDLHRLPPWAQRPPLRASGRASSPRLSLDLAAPLQTLAGEVSVSFGAVAVAGRAFHDVRATATMGAGAIRVDRASAELDGGGAIEATGTVRPGPGTFDARVTATSLSLAAVAGTGGDGPLQGLLDLEAVGSGALADPDLSATATLADVRFDRIAAPRLVVTAERRPGADLVLDAPEFLPRMRLNPRSGLTWRDGAFTDVVVMVDINRLTPQDLLPSLKVRDLWARMTGNVQFRAALADPAAFELKVIAPPDALVVGLFNREVVLVNQERLQVDIDPDGAIHVTGLSLWDGAERVRVCGRVRDADGDARLLVKGALGAYGLRAIKDSVSLAEGYLHLAGSAAAGGAVPRGCAPDMVEGDGAIVVGGRLPDAPVLTGAVTTGSIEVGLRRVADTLRVQPGGRVLLGPGADGRQSATIDPDRWIRGAFGDGTATVFGNLSLRGFVPDSGEIGLTGAGLRIVSPGEFYFVANPALRARFQGLAGTDAPDVTISGQVAVTEGSYHRNFDVVRKAFSGFTGRRVAQRSGRSLADALPWLAGAKLDVALTGTRFGVRSKVLVGSTDLELGMNLQVRGTIGQPELWNRVEIQPGGKMTYDVVRREFEVVRGTLDFTGPMTEPLVDLTARTRVEYAGSAGDALVSSSRFSPDDSGGGLFDDQAVLVTLAVSGRYPDLDLDLSSNSKSLTQTDLQYLLLTGSTQAEGGSQMSSTFNLGLLTEDVTSLVTQALLGSFVDAISFGVSPSGGVNVDVMAHMGSRLKFDTRVLQGQGASRYSAGFHVRLTERLSLQGRVRGVEQSMDPDEIGQTYETKLRYRIPLE